jgi:hypothetical protein
LRIDEYLRACTVGLNVEKWCLLNTQILKSITYSLSGQTLMVMVTF